MTQEAKKAQPAAETTEATLPLVDVFVKGGTTTTAYDNMLAQQRAETNERRAAQDRMYTAAAQAPQQAHMMSMKLGGRQTSQCAVLAVKDKKDSRFLEYIVCELIDQGDELVLNMACPRCHAKNPGHEPDFMIRQKHRAWWLDPQPPKWMRQSGALAAGHMWVNPDNPNEPVIVAGSVTTQDWIKCPGLGCTWTFKIDDSVVHER